MNQSYEKVLEGNPEKPGMYMTNFGELQYDGEKFLMKGERRGGGSALYPTTVEWWLAVVKKNESL